MEVFALGELGMSIFEFDYLTPRQYQNKVKGHFTKQERQLDGDWERTRFLAWCVLKTIPQKKSSNKLKSPEDMFKLPSEERKEREAKKAIEPMSREEVEDLIKRWS